MGKFMGKRLFVYFAVIALFLFAAPLAVCRGQDTPDSSSACGSAVFSRGVTVESLQAQLDKQGGGEKLTVWKKDGDRRLGGEIESGDVLEVTDAEGNPESRVTAVVGEDPIPGSSSGERDPSSSRGASKAPSSNSGPVEISGRERAGYYIYDRPVTVEGLKEQASEKLSSEEETLEIVARSGRERTSGDVCTGDTVKLVDAQGKTESSVIAVIPGDLTRCGRTTQKAGKLLYSYLTGKEGLEGDLLAAADMDGNGTVNTADLLRLKKELSGVIHD